MIELIARCINRNLLALMSRFTGVIHLVETVGLPNIDVLIAQHKLDKYRKEYTTLNFFLIHLTGALFHSKIKSLRNMPKALSKNQSLLDYLNLTTVPCHDALGEELRKYIDLLVDFNANIIIKAKSVGAIKKSDRVLYDDVKIFLRAKRYEETHTLPNRKTKQYEPALILNLTTTSPSNFIGLGIVESGRVGATKVYPSLKQAMDELIGSYEQAYDMGYTDLNRYIDHQENKEKFVTPLKSNISFTPLAGFKFRGRKDGILADINAALDSIDKYVFRLIKKKKRTKKGSFYLLTNDFEKKPEEIVGWYGDRNNIEVVAKDATIELDIKKPYGYLFDTVVASILFRIVAYNMLMLFKFIANKQEWSIRDLIDYVAQPYDQLMIIVEDTHKKIIELYDQMDKHRSLSAPKLTTLANCLERQFIQKC
jgi:hypothetical protein